MKQTIILFFILFTCSLAQAQTILKGRIISATDSLPLPGASIRIQGNNTGQSTAADGSFSISINEDNVLHVSYLGYQSREINLRLQHDNPLLILLQENENRLSEVVVSTGYQSLPKERATGSFVQVDNELLNRRVSTDVLSRLEDAVPGLVFNRQGDSRISIRGQSTISANAEPLIVLDNFPYEGDINSINPNDIESITVLKDAAAASIWGARAGNGVIVINTKKGRYKQALKVAVNSSVNIGARPDLFYEPKISSSDYIAMEQLLFSRGFYKAAETSTSNSPLSPVVELLIAARDGTMAAAETDARIAALKQEDVRLDFGNHFYRESMNQQHALNLSGGSERQHYYVSLGYDRNLSSLVRNDQNRFTLNASNTYRFAKDRLELNTGIQYTENRSTSNNPGMNGIRFSDISGAPLYPYARLADASGNALVINHDYRASFLQDAKQDGLLNWEYSPLQELYNADHTSRSTDYLLNGGLSYTLIPGLIVQSRYQYGRSLQGGRELFNQESYYTRNQINRLSAVNPDGSLTYPIPMGSILNAENAVVNSHFLRAQLNFNRVIQGDHSINALGGWEMRDAGTFGTDYRLYGYDEEHALSKAVDYITPFKRYDTANGTAVIPYTDRQRELSDRFISYFANAAYSYKQRYIFSISGRIDKSNIFGVDANQKGVPLWSAGLAWTISDEAWYKPSFLPYLKVRASYGYSGNTDRSMSAYTTASYSSGSSTLSRQPFAAIINPPNPELQWERVKMINLGIDFQSAGNVLSGTLEFYTKRGLDLFGSSPFAPASGISLFKGNNASTSGRGIDLVLNSQNIDRIFKWNSNFLFSYNSDKVTEHKVRATATAYVQTIAQPYEGNALYGMYSYAWGGLDHQTGDPMGYLDGQLSKDYSKLISSASPENIIYHGSARPVLTGSLRNNLSWKNFGLSFMINYRLGYYIRQASVRYATVLSGQGGHADYALRWQKPGDELITSVPSMPLVSNNNRDNLYSYSTALVQRADHIRFQDINLSYGFDQSKNPWLKGARIYVYANNLGIIWKAANSPLDPDYRTLPPQRTIAAGLSLNF